MLVSLVAFLHRIRRTEEVGERMKVRGIRDVCVQAAVRVTYTVRVSVIQSVTSDS